MQRASTSSVTMVPVQTSAMNSSLVTVSPGRAAMVASTSITFGSTRRTSSPRVSRLAIGSAIQSPTRKGAVTVGWSAVDAGSISDVGVEGPGGAIVSDGPREAPNAAGRLHDACPTTGQGYDTSSPCPPPRFRAFVGQKGARGGIWRGSLRKPSRLSHAFPMVRSPSEPHFVIVRHGATHHLRASRRTPCLEPGGSGNVSLPEPSEVASPPIGRPHGPSLAPSPRPAHRRGEGSLRVDAWPRPPRRRGGPSATPRSWASAR